MASLVLLLSLLAALALIFAPKLPVWTDPHTPHINRPPLILTSGQVLTQTFKFEYPTLDRVVIGLDRSQAVLTNGSLQVKVSTKNEDRSLVIPWQAISPEGLVIIQLNPPLRGGFGQAGTITLQLEQLDQSIAVAYQADASKYVDGELKVPGTKYRGDIAFQLRYQRAALGQWRLHWAYAAVLLLAGSLIAWWLYRPIKTIVSKSWLTKNDPVIAFGCFVFITVFYGSYLLNQGFWVGAGDLSKDASYLQPAAQALLTGSWPIWSHLTCGGMALTGNPEGNTFSLGTLLATVLPPDQAFLLLLVIEAGLAAAGTYVLGRALKLGVWGSLIATIIAILSPAYAYRIVEGLTPIGGAVAATPWVLLGLVRAIQSPPAAKWWAIFSGLCLSSVVLRGDVHVVTGIIIVVIIWCLVSSIRLRQWQPLLILTVIGTTALLVSSIKILPYLEQPDLLDHHAIKPYVAILSYDNQFQKVFLRLQDRSHSMPVKHGELESFGNFGTYLGILPFILAAWGWWQKKPYRWELTVTALAIFVIAEGTVFDLYLRYVPGLDALMRVPTRLLNVFVVLLGLLAGQGIEGLKAKPRPGWKYVPAIALSLALFFELGLATHTVFKQNLVWNHDPIAIHADQPTLMPHLNDSPQQAYSITKLTRAGYLLPHVCADQNNPPNFIKDLDQPMPVADVPVILKPNQILLRVAPQPFTQDIPVRERFVSSWISQQAELLPNEDGSIKVLIPPNSSQTITLNYVGSTATTQKVLFILMLTLILGAMLQLHVFKYSFRNIPNNEHNPVPKPR